MRKRCVIMIIIITFHLGLMTGILPVKFHFDLLLRIRGLYKLHG